MAESKKNPGKKLTQEERNHQRALTKIRRLNQKLTQVKLITADIEKATSSGKQNVSIKQVSLWNKKLKDILNLKDPEE